MAGRGDAWSGMGAAWTVTGTLLAGIVVWGGLGYLIDRWVGLEWLFLPIGMLVGISASIYVVYVRFGRDEHHET
ncbi:MAG TPA: AtpZ/AtpI family protein [Actinomycetota bacterium]|nr:AtpZ/AtpI family protein [Actinomycetota bacterium]HYG71906.1 AtpZ/AtpI family protein [Actinomycetota bacterium]